MKKIKILGMAAVIAVAFVSGQMMSDKGLSVLTYANSGEPGTSGDPVVTESYMKQELGKLQTQINQLKNQIGSGGGTTNPTPPPSQNLGTATVTANSLNVRSGSSTSSSVVGSLSKGMKVTILEKKTGWYKIQSGSLIGWASSDYLSTSGSTNPTPPPVQTSKATVTANSLNVRSSASTSSSVVGSLKKGNVVDVLEKKSGWYKIKYGSITGWASSTYLK